MDQDLDIGRIQVSQFLWESAEAEHIAAMELLKQEITLIASELNESMILENDLGTYILTCRSRHFNQSRYGLDHVYSGCFINSTDDKLSLTIEP